MTKTKFTKIEKSWIAYDWANSVHSTIIVAAIFPIFFASVVKNTPGLAQTGDVYWGWATSAATLVMAFMAPILGAIGDFKGMKKRMFSAFLFLGLVFTLIMAITNDWRWMLAGYSLSYLGFSGANLFYDSFITDVTTHDRMDKVSAWGFSMGYIGGSTIPFVIAIVLVMFSDTFFAGAASPGTVAVKISVYLTVLWWAVFSIPILRNVKQKYFVETPPKELVKETFINILKTLKHITHDKALLFFMLAYFFYIDGVNSVIHMATAYGSTLELDSTGMILALLLTQLVAVPFAIWFSKLSGRFGAINMISLAIGVYFIICVLGFIMGYGVEDGFLTKDQALVMFFALAVLVGTCQGGIQALSRSFFGKLIPPERSNEFFGFYDIFGKFAAFIGPALYALIATLTGRSSLGILSIIILFAAGGGFILGGRDVLRVAESRAIASADKARSENGNK
ncbi:MAG: MFS transporter [Saccharofermentanales bacterium]